MVLSAQEIKTRITEPQAKTELQLAIQNEDRVKFHAKPAATPSVISPYYTKFILWIEQLLPADKVVRFKQLLLLPVASNEVCDAIFSELYKVFKSGNKRTETVFSRSEFNIEFAQFLEDTKFEQNFEAKAKQLMREGFNSVIVVDLPVTPQPKAIPYFYSVSIDSVIDVELDSNGRISLLLFKDSSGDYIAIDSEKYVVFKEVESEEQSKVDYQVFSENYHQLGFTPAQFFWDQALYTEHPIVKQSPINKSLGAFDWFLFFHTSRKYLEMYAAYPIITAIQNDCDYKNEQGNTCDGGRVLYSTETPTGMLDTYAKCPSCEKRSFVGPGTLIGVSAPSKDEPNLLESVKVIPAEKESLEYNQKEEARKKDLLISYNAGIKDSDLKQAQNEMQITRGFESSQSILENIADNVAKIHHFILSTYAKLLFADNHKSTTVNYGDEFYQVSIDTLETELKNAQASNAPVYVVETIRKQMHAQKYRNDPRMVERMKILRDLEPYPSLSTKEVLELPENFFDAQKFSIKTNLAKFVSMFESENGDIVDFASLGVPYSKKLNIITQKLIEYGKEPITE